MHDNNHINDTMTIALIQIARQSLNVFLKGWTDHYYYKDILEEAWGEGGGSLQQQKITHQLLYLKKPTNYLLFIHIFPKCYLTYIPLFVVIFC